MKIKMLLGLAGANFSLAPGDVPLDDQFSDKEAQRLVDAGLAEPLKDNESAEVTLALTLDNENLLKELEELRALASRLAESEARIVFLIGENDALQQRAEGAELSLADAVASGGILNGRVVDLEKALADSAALLEERDALQRRAEDAETSLAEAAERCGMLERRIAELEKALGDGAADQGKKSKSGAG